MIELSGPNSPPVLTTYKDKSHTFHLMKSSNTCTIDKPLREDQIADNTSKRQLRVCGTGKGAIQPWEEDVKSISRGRCFDIACALRRRMV
jgi:hypothetical protein